MLAMLTETDYHFRVTEPFRACAAKVRFDSQGNRMVFLKVLSGRLAAKDEILTPEGMGKVNELRVYNGAKYKQTSCVEAGDFVAVVGLQEVKPGDIIGISFGDRETKAEVLAVRDNVRKEEVQDLFRFC